MANRSNYFFSLPDIEYKLIGSRDPLGLQVIWQAAGSQIIPYLSTVSSNIRDFKIWLLAQGYLRNGQEPLKRADFIRFEQVCAHARLVQFKDDRFNGIDKARKKKGNLVFPIGDTPSSQLLANQITYGIWGKYNRPYQSMVLENYLEDFKQINPLTTKEKKLLKKCFSNFELKRNDIDHISFLNITSKDKQFFSKNLLQINKTALAQEVKEQNQNTLYQILKSNQALVNLYRKPKDANKLFVFLNDLHELANQDLKDAIENIIATEKVISPLNRIFRHLQTKRVWESANDTDIDKLKEVIGTLRKEQSTYDFKRSLVSQELQKVLNTDDVWALIVGIAKRNMKVSSHRKKLAWIELQDNDTKLIINEQEGQNNFTNWNCNYSFTYFFDTYIHLFTQLNN